jgi:hypothetical protein
MGEQRRGDRKKFGVCGQVGFNCVIEYCCSAALFGISPVAEEVAGITDGGFNLEAAVMPRQPGVKFRGGKNVRLVSQSSLVIECAHWGSDPQLVAVTRRNMLRHTAEDRIDDASPRHTQSAHRTPESSLIRKRAFVGSKATQSRSQRGFR